MTTYMYYTPTEVIFGKEAENEVGKVVGRYKGTKVLIHYGGGSVKRSGLLDRVKHSLEAEGIAYVELGGVVPNPRLSLVYEGIELSKEHGVDFILAVGGGSVIDSAKAIGYGVANEGDVWDFYNFKRKAEACLPIGSILTIAAAGSEMSNSSVVTKEEGWEKRSYNNNLGRPVFSIMNPELTMTLPAYQVASGCVDILMHTMERYFNQGASMEVTDSISEALMRTVITNSTIVKNDATNYDAFAELMWASSLSHNGLTGFGAEGGGDWATHMLEHELSGMFDVTHGAGLAAVWGSWARYVFNARVDRFARFAVNVLNVSPGDTTEQTALAGIAAMEQFYRSIDMPTSIKELGIEVTDEQIEEMAEKCSVATRGSIGALKKLNKTDMIEIYRAAK